MRITKVHWALIALTLWTLAVRLYGIDFGVPCLREADTFIADHTRMLREGEVKLDRALSAVQYPSLLAHAAAPLSDATFEANNDARTLEEHLKAAAQVWLDVRWLVAWLSILIVPATYSIARRFVEPSWALFAAALVSFSLLHVFFTQEARAHGPVIAFSACAVACALHLRSSPGWSVYLATALFAGLAIGTLHNGLAVLAPIAVAQLTRRDRRWFDARLLLIAAAAVVSFRVFYWYYFDAAAQQAMAGDDATQSVLRDLPFDGTGFVRLARTIWFYEPVLLGLIALAGVLWLTQRTTLKRGWIERGDALVVLSYVAPYVLLAGLFNQTYERFLLPLLPYLATFAAFGLATLHRKCAARGGLVVAASIASLALPAYTSTKLSYLRGSPSTLDQTAAWVRDNIKEPEQQSVFLLPPLDLPLFRTTESLRYPAGRAAFFSPWSRYQNKLEPERRVAPLYRLYWISGKEEFGLMETEEELEAFLRSHGAGYFIVNTIAPNQSPERARIVAALRRIGRRVARISPDSDPDYTDHQLFDQDVEAPHWRHVTRRLLQARAIGPIIEIFELR